MRKVRIAVIMPYHNGMKDFIEKSIRAVAGQIGVDVTLYITDNGSTDGTADLVAKVLMDEQKRRPEFWVVKIKCDKPGVAYARNAAMDEMLQHWRKGNIVDGVAFCDCDDVWDAEHLKLLYTAMEANEADMVYSDVRCVDEDNNPLQITGIPYYMTFDRKHLLNQNFIFISTVLVRPLCISTVGGFDHDVDPMGDWDYWIRTSEKYKVFHHQVTTVTYLWKTKSGSYYDPSKMITATELVKSKHHIANMPAPKPENNDKYSHVSGWLTPAEGAILQKYAAKPNESTMSFGRCLEIGSYKGKSSCYIAEVARELTCIDTFLADTGGQAQVEESTYDEFRRNTKQFANKIRAIVGRSSDMHNLIQDDYFDMIFLDAMHDYTSVYNDIKNYWSKLKKGGYILFHDFANDDYMGVRQAARALLGDPAEVVDSIGVYCKDSGELLSQVDTKEYAVEVAEIDYSEIQEKLAEQKISASEKKRKVAVLAPFANKLPDGKVNPKNLPLETWREITSMLKEADIYTVQIGLAGEPFVGADEMRFNLTNDSLKKLVEDMDFFVSVDTFFQHFATYHGKRGIVIFSQSDPNIFGHSSNVNILKSREYLRADQFQMWTQTEYNISAFPSANQVFEEIMKLLEVS